MVVLVHSMVTKTVCAPENMVQEPPTWFFNPHGAQHRALSDGCLFIYLFILSWLLLGIFSQLMRAGKDT